ncbi:MAG: phytanoyl-CoA dioxygenase family protein [Planctomycetales bacterium]|nr:phytanoyl-CoA dioxygenase family protein [Planctomycetales bacterium]
MSMMELKQLDQLGYVLLEDIYSTGEMQSLAQVIAARLAQIVNTSALRSRGELYGSRNLVDTVPEIVALGLDQRLMGFLQAVLGGNFGLVRALYFDKPPNRTWSLPWHRDETIAVQRNDLGGTYFTKPTMKGGVAHVVAPPSLLSKMLTLRIHIDAMTDENGPLSVIPGSHRLTEANLSAPDPVTIHAWQGDVMAMRPLLSHSSCASRPGTLQHRRIVHLEYAASPDLPDGYAWHTYLSLHSLNQ